MLNFIKFDMSICPTQSQLCTHSLGVPAVPERGDAEGEGRGGEDHQQGGWREEVRLGYNIRSEISLSKKF